jgi:hypothetical protein
VRMKSTKRMLPGLLVVAGLIGGGLTTAAPAGAEPTRAEGVVSAAAAPAHSLRAARTHAVVKRNSWQQDVLVRKSQQNWYRLKLTSRSYVYSLLGSLPANYNLRLYDETGKVLRKSNRKGLRPESVGRTLGPGTYYLRVASTKGSSRSKKYALLVRVVPGGSRLGILTARVDNSGLVVGDLVNVSKQTLAAGHMDVSFYGANGKLLRRYRDNFNHLWTPVAPGHRAPFHAATIDVPKSVLKKTTRVSVVPLISVLPTRSAAKLSVSRIKRKNVHHGSWTDVKVTGRINNKGSRAVSVATAVFEIHDKRGVLIGLEEDEHGVPAHSHRKFAMNYFSWTANPATSVKVFETTGTLPDPE